MATHEITEGGLMRALATVERLDPEAAARMTEFTPGTVPRIHQVAERAYFVGELCAFLAERVEGLTREVERVEELTRRVEALEEATKKRPRGRPPKDAEGELVDDPVLGHGEDGRPLFRSELVAGDWASQERMVASARELADTMDQLLDWPDNADLRHAVEELADAYARQDPRAARDAEIRYLGCLYRLKETGVLE